MAVKTPFERHQKSHSSNNMFINILIILIVLLGSASIYLSRDRISSLRSNASIVPTTDTMMTDGILGPIGSSVTLSGLISINSTTSADFTHTLTTSNQVIGLKSSLIDLNTYTGEVSLEGIVQAPAGTMPVVEITSVLAGNPATMTTSGDTTEDLLTGEELVMTGDTTSVQTGDTEDTVTAPTTPSVSASDNAILVEPSVSQFRINTGKTLNFKVNRGFTIVFPTQNIAYQANNINTGLEYGKDIACSVVTNTIVYKDAEQVNESPSVQIYECSTKRGFDTSKIQGYRVLPGNSDRKVFLIKANDPTRTRFANNIEIYYGDAPGTGNVQ